MSDGPGERDEVIVDRGNDAEVVGDAVDDSGGDGRSEAEREVDERIRPAFGAAKGDAGKSAPAAVIRASGDQALLRAIDPDQAVAEGAVMARDAELRTGVTPGVLARLQDDQVVSSFIKLADEFLGQLGFTEHGFRHANLVGRIAYNVLHHLGAEQDLCELAAIGGYLHDVGNVVSRANHGLSSAWIAYDALRRLEVDPARIGLVLSAVGNHEEQYGSAIGPVGAAVILADKADVHRSRVRKGADTSIDIHDRVNDAVTHSFLRVDADKATITLELELDTDRSTVVEYFEIFLERMTMCRRAARTLGCEFHIAANGVVLG